MPDNIQPGNIIESFFRALYQVLETPVVFVREKIVEPNQKQYPWYHQKFRRVPTIDTCYTDDMVCFSEANYQYKMDRLVDSEIISILRQRFENCVMYETPDHLTKCRPILDQYEDAQTNWFIKYGDLGGYHDVKKAYMKQKHRMIWERRYGPVGSGITAEATQEE